MTILAQLGLLCKHILESHMPPPPYPWALQTPEIQGKTARVAGSRAARPPGGFSLDPASTSDWTGPAPLWLQEPLPQAGYSEQTGPTRGGPDFSSGACIIPHCAPRRKTQRLQGNPRSGLTGTQAAHTVQLASPRAVRDRGPLPKEGPLRSLPTARPPKLRLARAIDTEP